ncbi:hypothetical protein AB0P21_28930 [Kribbella sp. NPDC056861]|uniref:hypothetical protein n=1 Tax=Kribbella sp. NPDC056861 TaxID=3154857 RepID=UPI0034162493
MIKRKLRSAAAFTAALATVATGAALATAPAQAATSTTQAAAISNTLLPGQRLLSGQYIRSADRHFTLVMRATGNLELVETGVGVVWDTNTTRAGSVLVMEKDGGLSLVHGRTKYWISGAKASPNAKLVLPTDGNLTVFNTAGRSVWNRHMVIETMSPGYELWPPTGYVSGAVSLFSRNRVYTLQVRPNGALELMQNNKVKLWSAPYKPSAGNWAFLLADGTFGMRSFWDTAWTIPTKRAGTVLQLRDDGKLLLIHGRTVVKVLH